MRKKYSRLTSDEQLEIIKLYGSGMSMEEVGEKLSISTNTAFIILKKHNVPTRKQNNKHKILTIEDLINIRRRIDNGELQCRIADEYGVHESTISIALKRNNIKGGM